MEATEHDLADTLRALAREGVPPSWMLREVVRLAGGHADRQYLVRVVADAFRFAEGEAYVVFGWLPDGAGELTDAQLDHHLGKRITAARPLWDAAT